MKIFKNIDTLFGFWCRVTNVKQDTMIHFQLNTDEGSLPLKKRLNSILHGIGFLSILWFPYSYLAYLPAALYFERKNRLFMFGAVTLQLVISISFLTKNNTEEKWGLTALISILMFFASDIHEYFNSDKPKKLR